MARQETLKIGKKTLAFGLTWQTPEPDITPQKAAQTFNREVGNIADIAVYRSEPIPQFALGSSSEGLRANMHSAAAILANTLQGSWLVAMETSVGVWICSGREDCLLPNGDVLFDDPEMARVEFESRQSQGGWTTVFAPAGWGYSADEIVPEALTSGDLGPSTRLVDMASTRSYLKLALTIGFLAGASFLGMAFFWPKEEVIPIQQIDTGPDLEEEYARLDRELRPWLDSPEADSLLANCVDAIRDLPATVPGFSVESAECTNGSLELNLGRTPSSYTSWLREWVGTRQDLEIAGTEPPALSATITPLAGGGDFQNLPDIPETLGWLRERGEIERADINAGDFSAPFINEYPEYSPSFMEGFFTIGTRYPDIWVSAFGSKSGFRISSVTLNFQSEVYTIEGSIYVRNR